METLIDRLTIEELLSDNSKTFRQVDKIPTFLLSANLNDAVHNSSKILSKYNFTMSLEDFEQTLKPHFREVETTSHVETYYDAKDEQHSIMKGNVWIKLVRYYGKDEERVPMVSIKRTYQDAKGDLLYKEKLIDFPIISELAKETQYKLDVQRTKYLHEIDNNTILTLDRVTYPDDTSFVVFSLTCDFEEEESNQCPTTNMYLCRSKIIEFLYNNRKELYDTLLENGNIRQLNYKCMSIAQFEKGPEIAKQYEKEAEEEVKKLQEENEKLEKPEYSDSYIRFVKRNILKYGLQKDDEEDDE